MQGIHDLGFGVLGFSDIAAGVSRACIRYMI